MGYGDRGLVLRDLMSGRERQTQTWAAEESQDTHVGHVVWSPDGESLMLTVAIDACGPPEKRTHTIVRVDAVARVGETVRLSGGEVPVVEDHTSVEIPERCAGPYWLAGSEIERAESE